MESFLKSVAVVAIIANLQRHVGADLLAGENAGQFSLLCQIYTVAKHPPINYVDPQSSMKLVEDINAINVSLSDEKWFNEIDKTEDREKLDEDFKKAHPDYPSHWDMWKKAVGQVSAGKEVTRVTPNTMEAKLCQARLQRITQKAHKILEEIKKINIKGEINKARTEFDKVIFGDIQNEEGKVKAGALRAIGNRAAACGAGNLASRGTHAGSSLIVDFFCLCADKNSDSNGLKGICGVDIGDQSSGKGWEESAAANEDSMWDAVTTACAQRTPAKVKSTQEARALLGEFLSEVARGGLHGANRDKRKPGLLGNSAANNGGGNIACDGDKRAAGNNHGICVYYGDGSKSGQEWNKIVWLGNMETALVTLEDLQNKSSSIQHDITRLKTLWHRAEEIYEEAKSAAGLEKSSLEKAIQMQDQKQNPNSSTNRPTSQDPTAVSPASIPRFILPWAFLI